MEIYRVIVSERAKQMLAENLRFAAKAGKANAHKTRQRLIAAMRSLETMPNRYPFFQEAYIPANRYHKMFVEKWYLILYQIQDDTVLVDYIIDGRKDYTWLFK